MKGFKEVSRGNQAPQGMPPTDERFDATQNSIVQAHLGLVEHLKFIVFEGSSQFYLERSAFLQLLRIRKLVRQMHTGPAFLRVE